MTQLALAATTEDTEVSSVGPGPEHTVEAIVPPDETRERCCAQCSRPLPPQPANAGRPRRFCGALCREAARLRRVRGVPEDLPRQPNHHGRRGLGDRRDR